jgi:hypothetical protein
MDIVMREYQTDPASIDEITRRVEEGFVPIISGAAGFVSYTLVDFGNGDLTTFSTFEEKGQAEESVSRAAGWVRENLASLLPNPPRVTTGEVLLRDAKTGERPTYGALRRYRTDPANTEEIVRRVRDGLLPIIQRVSGYVSYLAVDFGDGMIGSASTFADQAAAEQSSRTAVEWVQSNLAPLITAPPDVKNGRILLRHAKQ